MLQLWLLSSQPVLLPDAQSPTIKEAQKIVVSTQEQPVAEDATTHSSAAQPASEANAEGATPTQPAQ